MKHMSLDAHQDFCTFSVRNARGEQIDLREIPTRGPELIDAIRSYGGKKTLVVEEGNLAGWLKRTLEPHVTRFIVSNPKENKWIAQDEGKDDPIDAAKLSHLQFGGFIKEVYHPSEHRQRFKDLVLHCERLTRQVSRSKNHLNARQRANRVSDHQEPGSEPIHLLTQSELDDLGEVRDAVKAIRKQARARLKSEAAKYPEIERFTKVPGVGIIHATVYFAIVDTPYRFKKKSKLWTYCGLGLKKRKSGGRVYRQRRGQEYNRYLKAMAMRSAQVAINQSRDNRYKSQYHCLLDKGVHHRKAHVIVARSIVSTLWGMWRSGQPYQPDREAYS